VIELLVDVLAVHRLTRLVVADTITRPARRAVGHWAAERAGDFALADNLDADLDLNDALALAHVDGTSGPMVAELLTCRWCVSVWVALGVVVARRVAPRAWRPVAVVLALSSASTLLVSAEA
jgi:hypothetical protein